MITFLFSFLIVLLIVGLLNYAVTLLPIDARWIRLIHLVLVLIVVAWLLSWWGGVVPLPKWPAR